MAIHTYITNHRVTAMRILCSSVTYSHRLHILKCGAECKAAVMHGLRDLSIYVLYT